MKRSKYILIVGLAVLATALASCEKNDVYYRLYFPENPVSFFGGEESVLTSKVVTNIPQADLVVETPSWITASIDADGAFLVHVARNESNGFRQGDVVLSDRKGRTPPLSWSVEQAYVIRNGSGMVQFTDCAFKSAILEIADADADFDISPDEALSVEEIVATGKGIKSIDGIDAFKNVWKIDLRDNDIEDATLVKDHPYLYWLDLSGNKNLKTFDVRGCSEYFSHCEFEITEDLLYYCWDRQVNICTTSDPDGEHSKHVFDDRQTTEWSRQNRIVPLKEHTEGDGHVKICFTGLGWLDVDLEDGTFERVMRESFEAVLAWPWIKGHEEKIDFYYMERLSEDRHQWAYERVKHNQGTNSILQDSWDLITENSDVSDYKVLTITVDNSIRPHTPCNMVFAFYCGENFSTTYRNDNQWLYIHSMNALTQVEETDPFYENYMSCSAPVSYLFDPETPSNFYPRDDFFTSVF